MAPKPVPTSSNRAAYTNRLALLSASQASLFKTMNLTPSSSRSTRNPQPQEEGDDNGDDFAGIGFVRQSDKETTRREDDALRGRLLGGKRKGKGVGDAAGGWERRKKEESSEDEEEGRGSLGKRKRPRSVREESKTDTNDGEEVLQEGKDAGDSKTAGGDDRAGDLAVEQAQEISSGSQPKRKKNKKNKKKNKKAA